MKELLDALKAFFNAQASGPLALQFTGGFYLIDVPAGDADRYCVMTPVSAPSTAGYGRASLWSEPEIQFAVWAVGADTPLDLLRLLTDKLDALDLALDNGRRLQSSMRLTDSLPMPGSGSPNNSNDPVFGWFVTYRFAVSS